MIGAGLHCRLGRSYSVLTSLSFHKPGMQKDSRRSLPHRSKMRNSTDDKQAGGKRHVLSKQHVYWIQTNQKELRHSRKETRGHDTGVCSVCSVCSHDSPISSYLIAVPRFAFSSDVMKENTHVIKYTVSVHSTCMRCGECHENISRYVSVQSVQLFQDLITN